MRFINATIGRRKAALVKPQVIGVCATSHRAAHGRHARRLLNRAHGGYAGARLPPRGDSHYFLHNDR
jgi:hypothetical protein